MKKIIYIILSLLLLVIGLQAQNTELSTDSIDSIITEQERKQMDESRKRDAQEYIRESTFHTPSDLFISIGIGLGGSNIAGVDVEYKFNRIYPIRDLSVQAGLGYTGFDAGINYRLGQMAKVGSLIVGLQYRYTGFGNDDIWGYSTSNIGPVVIFRGQKWFTAQVGAGYILDTGEAYSGSEDRKIQVHAGVGIYLDKKCK